MLETETLVERLARYLATRQMTPSPLQSDDPGQHIEAAASILAILKEPDAHMRETGDPDVWRRMIDAALVVRWTVREAMGGERGTPPGGFDEEGEVPYNENASGVEKTPSWIQLSDPPKP